MPHITLPDVFPYLLAILGLLLIWQLYDIQVRAGRIKVASTMDRSGIRWFLHVTPMDTHACVACRTANGMAFLPSVVTTKKFRPSAQTCTNAAGCRCLLVGLSGSWSEAERVLAQLKAGGGRIRLSPEQLEKLLAEAQAKGAGIAADQVSVGMLFALQSEGRQPQAAIDAYRQVLAQAKKERDLPLLVPAYLRLADLLERTGKQADALEVTDRFLSAYSSKPGMPKPAHAPTEDQRTFMSLRKTRLMAARR
nr:tetratricopeptide repeat protein [Nitrospirota bacterium]